MYISLALWSHPRSMSTAFERSFIARGDFAVFHEAFSYVYYVHEHRAHIPHLRVDPSHPRTFPDVKRLMEAARRDRPVFHKDFPYHALDHLLADPEYLRGQINTFLIRDPTKAIPSLLAVHPAVTREALGYTQLWRLFEAVRGLTDTVPLVVDADQLLADPPQVMARYCDRVGIEFMPEALHWSPGSCPEWASWPVWHQDVMRSVGFALPAKDRRSQKDATALSRARELVDYCMPYYRSLRGFATNQMKGATS